MEDVVTYLTQINATLESNKFETEEEKETLLENVSSEIKGVEVKLAKTQEGSRILEALFSKCTTGKILLNYLEPFIDNIVDLSFHSYSSRVIERLFDSIKINLLAVNEIADEEENLKKLFRFLRKIQTHFRGDKKQEGGGETETTDGWGWIDLLYDAKASHVIRKYLDLLVDIPNSNPDDKNKIKKISKLKKKENFIRDQIEVKKKLWKCVMVISEDLLSDKRSEKRKNLLKFSFKHTNASPGMQIFLEKLNFIGSFEFLQEVHREQMGKLQKHAKINVESLLNKMIDFSNPNQKNNLLCQDKIASHFLEKIIPYLTENQYYAFYLSTFRNQLKPLSTNQSSNFVVQKMIYSIHKQAEAGLFISELLDSMENLLYTRTGVVISLFFAAQKFSVYLKELKNKLSQIVLKSNNENSHKQLLPLLYKHLPKSNGLPIHFSKLSIQLFAFPVEHSKSFLSSFLQLDTQDIVNLFFDATGSRLVEAYFDPKFDAKFRVKFFKKVAGNWPKIAKSKTGSRCLDFIFSAVNVQLKENITKELAEAEHELINDFNGRFALFNCNVKQYKLKAEQWEASIVTTDKKRKMFDSLLNDTSEQPLTKKKKLNEPTPVQAAPVEVAPPTKKQKAKNEPKAPVEAAPVTPAVSVPDFCSEEHKNIMDKLTKKQTKPQKTKEKGKKFESSAEIDELFALVTGKPKPKQKKGKKSKE